MPIRRNKLNNNQIHLLKLIYKFRFVTSDLVAEHKGVNKSAINNAFSILMDQGYIARHYDKSYKLHGRPATYFLAPKSIKLLRDEHGLNPKVLHAMYKNKSVNSAFIEHNLNVLRVYLSIRQTYPDTFNIFTKSETADLDYMPQPAPGLYLNRKNPSEDMPNEYMLEIFTDTQFFIIKKRIDTYIEHFDSGDWPEQQYPVLLIACPDSRTEEKLHKYIQTTLDNNYIDEKDLRFLTTSTKSLLEPENPLIWDLTSEGQKLIRL